MRNGHLAWAFDVYGICIWLWCWVHLLLFSMYIPRFPTQVTFLYIRSVRSVNFVPLVTSAPEWRRFRCWKIRTRPDLGVTSYWRCMFIESVAASGSASLCLWKSSYKSVVNGKKSAVIVWDEPITHHTVMGGKGSRSEYVRNVVAPPPILPSAESLR